MVYHYHICGPLAEMSLCSAWLAVIRSTYFERHDTVNNNPPGFMYGTWSEEFHLFLEDLDWPPWLQASDRLNLA